MNYSYILIREEKPNSEGWERETNKQRGVWVHHHPSTFGSTGHDARVTCGFTTNCPRIADCRLSDCSRSLVREATALAGLGRVGSAEAAAAWSPGIN